MKKQIRKQIISTFLITAFSFNYILAPAFAASATADSNASSDNKPTITEQNNVTVVNIAGPNQNGLSHNKYLDFNVNQHGLILNNALTVTNTQLAGNIAANSNLGGRQASVILNEVTSGNPSQINGLIEVAGKKADVIIANPNGISGSSFGFINTNRATLVTGVPNFDQNNKLNFNITGGQVSLSGTGAHETHMPTKFDILSRAVQINTEVWAQDEINVITGANKVDYETLSTEAKEADPDTKPTVALDVGAVGGMYSGKIRLIGTEKGLGVNVKGEIDATDTLTLDTKGNITIESKVENNELIMGGIRSTGQMDIKAAGDIENAGEISSNDNVTINAANLRNTGVISAGEAEELDDDENHDPNEEYKYDEAKPSELNINVTGTISGVGTYAASKQINLNGDKVTYSDINIRTDKLLVNGTEKNIDPIVGEPDWPEDTSDPNDYSDPMNNKNTDDSKLINIGDRDIITTADVKDDDLKLTADPNAGGNRPIIDKTASGIDLVQITGPNSNGVSVNYYTDFNIKSTGLILNNSPNYTYTQLGGQIANNPLMGATYAKTILNEVTSGNISQLYGFLEVAGYRANVVIANHNGITVNGLGFINASGATLLSNNYIKVSGDGLNASQTDNLNLSGGTITNNTAEIWATNLSTDANSLTNTGRIIATGDIELKGNSVSNEKEGFIYSEGKVSTDLNTFTNKENSSVFADKTMDIKSGQVKNDDSILFSGDNMTINANNVENTTNSLINSYGDIDITATGKVLNQSSNIESEGDIKITANELVNEKEVFKTDWTITYEDIAYGIPHLQQANYYSATRRFLRTIYTGTITEETDTAKIFADGDIFINVGDLKNHYSYISAGNDLTVNATNVENYGYQGTMILDDAGYDYHYWKYKKHRRMHIRCKMVYGQTLIPYTDTNEIDIRETRYGILGANGTVTINADNIDNKTVNAAGDELTFRSGNVEPTTTRMPDNITSGNFVITDKRFSINTDPEAKYLVETDPRFTDYKTFLSSDYLLERIKSDPDKVMKRLGDGYYEQKLITEQITELTGRRFLDGYSSEYDQFKALMENGATFAEEFELIPGIALTKEQMAALTSDIVWLVEQEVNGEKVLVPQVYLCSLREKDLITGGAVIVGNDVELFAKDTLKNVGTIKAAETLDVKAGKDIINKNGTIEAKDVNLEAGDTISNIGGLVKGTDISLNAENIVNKTTTIDRQKDSLTQTTIREVAGIVADGNISMTAKDTIRNEGAIISAGKTLDMTAKDIEITSVSEERRVAVTQGKSSASLYDKVHTGSIVQGGNVNMTADDITVRGSTVAADDKINITAKNEINITADKDISESDVSVGSRGSSYFGRQMENHETVSGSGIIAGGDISMTSGQDTTIRGSAVQSADGKVSISADNVNIVEETEKHESLIEKQEKTSGLLSKKSKKTYDYQSGDYVVGSSVSGNEIDITSTKDTNVTASTVIADKDVNINAGGDIHIQSAEQKSSSIYIHEEKKSGLMSGGGLGVSIGSEKQKLNQTTNNTEQVGSLVGSLEGSVNLNAGKDVNVKASDVVAGKDINIEGNNVNIESADHIYNFYSRYDYKKTGLTVSLGGNTINMLNNIYQPIERAAGAQTDQLKIMGSLKAGLGVYKAYKGGLFDSTNALNNNNLRVQVAFGSTKYNSTTTGTTTIAQGSNISAGEDVNIKAREKDINIVGSTVSGENITLEAKENVNIEASANTNTADTDSKSSSSSIGFNVGIEKGLSSKGGTNIGFEASASKSTGEVHDNSTTWTESTVTANDNLTVKSGEDTNIIGSQVKGDTVNMEVGGNLNVESLQDTENYDETNKTKGGSVGWTGGTPSGQISKEKQEIDSDYKSVQEQAGIYAGEGGFDITVGKNTDLKGAVIASEADAADNKLSTGTLTYSDIDNKAEFEAKTSGSSIGMDSGKVDLVGAALGAISKGIAGSEGDASSTTKSAIEEGTIEIRDNPDQDISDLSRDTDNANNPLEKIFDRDKVLEKQEAAKYFGEVGFYIVGQMIQKKIDSGEWKKGGAEAVLLHALIGGIMAEINGGDFGEGMTVAAINKLIISKISDLRDKDGKVIISNDALLSISALLGETIGGNQGAGISESATENNDLHNRQEVVEKYLTKEFIDEINTAMGRNLTQAEIDAVTAACQANALDLSLMDGITAVQSHINGANLIYVGANLNGTVGGVGVPVSRGVGVLVNTSTNEVYNVVTVSSGKSTAIPVDFQVLAIKVYYNDGNNRQVTNATDLNDALTGFSGGIGVGAGAYVEGSVTTTLKYKFETVGIITNATISGNTSYTFEPITHDLNKPIDPFDGSNYP